MIVFIFLKATWIFFQFWHNIWCSASNIEDTKSFSLPSGETCKIDVCETFNNFLSADGVVCDSRKFNDSLEGILVIFKSLFGLSFFIAFNVFS